MLIHSPCKAHLIKLNRLKQRPRHSCAVIPRRRGPSWLWPKLFWNVSKVVKGLHSWQHVCGHPLWERRFWRQGVFLWGHKSCSICWFNCRLRCTTICKTEDGNPLKVKGAFFYVDRVWIRPTVPGQFGVWSSRTPKRTQKQSVSSVSSKGTNLKHRGVPCILTDDLWATVEKKKYKKIN